MFVAFQLAFFVFLSDGQRHGILFLRPYNFGHADPSFRIRRPFGRRNILLHSVKPFVIFVKLYLQLRKICRKCLLDIDP